MRGLGRGRRTRRSLARGGTGVAGLLNARVGDWPGVRITPMFGRWGYFVGTRLFACFPLRAKDADLWVRLSRDDQARAVTSGVVVPHRRLSAGGWVECRIEGLRESARALDWLRKAYETARSIARSEERQGT